MSFISTAAHQKFISQCNRLVAGTVQHAAGTDASTERLTADLARLHRLAEDYLNTVSKLAELTDEYNTLRRHIRINMRKIQIVHSSK